MNNKRSLGAKAVLGAAWTIGSSIASRLIGVVGTLLVTRYMAPEVIGEVAIASILVLTANQLSNFGFGQYIVAHPKATRAATFHVSVFHLSLGVVAMGCLWFVSEPLTSLFESPNLPVYLPGLIAAGMLSRVALLPERVLIRRLDFRVPGIIRTIAEFIFTVTAISLAVNGWGGLSIIVANVVRALFRMIAMLVVVDWKEWLYPTRLDRTITRDIFSYGVPLAIGNTANFASRNWDYLIFGSMFGPGPLGAYKLAYGLADIPASQIGEHIGDVLLPSFAHMERDQRRRALVRATGLLSLLVFPLAVGLGCVADTLVDAVFTSEWQAVAPYLLILTGLSIVRPIGWTISSYLQATGRTRAVMGLELIKVVSLLGMVFTLSQIGPLWGAGGVGAGFSVHALVSMWAIERTDHISMRSILGAMVGPLLACVPMAVAVLLTRVGLPHLGVSSPLALLACECVFGAVVYLGAAALFAHQTARDFLRLIRRSIFRG